MTSAEALKSIRINILLTADQDQHLSEAARNRGISKAAYVRHALEKAFSLEDEMTLQKAVRELAPVYRLDPELTTFTDLDSEDFS